jgi:hypothetical protein
MKGNPEDTAVNLIGPEFGIRDFLSQAVILRTLGVEESLNRYFAEDRFWDFSPRWGSK